MVNTALVSDSGDFTSHEDFARHPDFSTETILSIDTIEVNPHTADPGGLTFSSTFDVK